jgi:hypothetical protein
MITLTKQLEVVSENIPSAQQQLEINSFIVGMMKDDETNGVVVLAENILKIDLLNDAAVAKLEDYLVSSYPDFDQPIPTFIVTDI